MTALFISLEPATGVLRVRSCCHLSTYDQISNSNARLSNVIHLRARVRSTFVRTYYGEWFSRYSHAARDNKLLRKALKQAHEYAEKHGQKAPKQDKKRKRSSGDYGV